MCTYSDSHAHHLPQTLAPKAGTLVVREMTRGTTGAPEQSLNKAGHLLGSNGFEMTGSTYQDREGKRTGPNSCFNSYVQTHLFIRGTRFLVSIVKHNAFLQRQRVPT